MGRFVIWPFLFLFFCLFFTSDLNLKSVTYSEILEFVMAALTFPVLCNLLHLFFTKKGGSKIRVKRSSHKKFTFYI